jgi:hypothetical protein
MAVIFLPITGHPYAIPETTVVGFVYTNRIKYMSPVHHDTSNIDIPQDSLGMMKVAGHEIGHMVNMGENPSTNSIMSGYFDNWIQIPHEYEQVDLDSFLVKPRH